MPTPVKKTRAPARRVPPARTAAKTAVKQSVSDVYRDAILEAARGEFIERGYAATKMTDIARRTGMSVGALYRHFDSKEAIFASLMGRDGEQVVTRMTEVAGRVRDPGERLGALLSTALTYIQEHSAMFLVFNQIGGADRAACHSLVDHATSIRERIFILYRGALADGVAAGTLRDDVAIEDQLAYFTGSVHGFLEAWIRGGAVDRVADKAPLITALTLRALGGSS